MKFKNLIGLLIIVLISLPLVFAQNGYGVNEKSTAQGFEQITVMANNMEQKQLLEQSMEKIQEQDRIKLNQLENLQVRAEVQVKNNVAETVYLAEGMEEKKFLNLFKFQVKSTYQINEEGGIMKQKGIFDFLFF